MQIFYGVLTGNDTFVLNEIESRHIIKVMRMRKGEEVNLIDGSGVLYKGVINTADPRKTIISVTGRIIDFDKRNYHLHIAIAPTKNIDRFEWFVEKSVEMGIDEITPVICEHSERRTIKQARIEKIIIGAMKQSGKAIQTIINPIISLPDFAANNARGSRFVSYCHDNDGKKGLNEVYLKGSDAVVLIGPEGDFTEKEINLLSDSSYTAIHLGNSRLRTETAGLVACCNIYIINQ